jgi:hypothetical protein
VPRLLCAGALSAALLSVSAGVAAADPLLVADVTQAADTDDGWHLSAALTRMTINSVPNMAATAFTREGFVTGKAAATIEGNGAVPVNSGTLVFGLQLGCQVDLSEGGSVGGDADIGINPGFSGSNVLSDIGPYADVGGNVSINLLPGRSPTSDSARRRSRDARVRSWSTTRTSRSTRAAAWCPSGSLPRR